MVGVNADVRRGWREEPALLQHARWASAALIASTAYALLVHALAPPSARLVAHTFDARARWVPTEMFRAHSNRSTLRWAIGSRRERHKQGDLRNLHLAHAANLTADWAEFFYASTAMQPLAPLREPFAVASCLAYGAHGIGLAALGGLARPGPSSHADGNAGRGAVARYHPAMPPQRLEQPRSLPGAPAGALGVLLTMLGAASAAHHLGGSRFGSWEHEADKVAMLSFLLLLAVTAVHGLTHAARGTRYAPGSPLDRRFAAAAPIGAACGLLLNRAPPSVYFQTWLPLGACALLAGGADAAALLLRTRPPAAVAPAPAAAGARSLGGALRATLGDGLRARGALLGEYALALLLLGGCTVYVNLGVWDPAKRRVASDPLMTDAERARAQAVCDWAHGSWHHSSALLLAVLSRCALEAAAGRGGPLFGAAARTGERRAAQRAVLVLWAAGGGVSCAALALADAPPGAWAGGAAAFAGVAALLARAHGRWRSGAPARAPRRATEPGSDSESEGESGAGSDAEPGGGSDSEWGDDAGGGAKPGGAARTGEPAAADVASMTMIAAGEAHG